jgi:hypothetical protein
MTTQRFSPLPEGTTVTTAIAELELTGNTILRDMILELWESTGDKNADSHITHWLDWAAQLRMGGMPWNEALRAAQIFYFG